MTDRVVLIVCPVCAERYARRVTAGCGVCDGIGVVAVAAGAIAASDEWAAARAASLYLATHDWRPRAEQLDKRRRAETAGLVRQLPIPGAVAVASPDLPGHPGSPSARSVVGRQAGVLLESLGLRRRREKVTREVVVGRARDVGTVRTAVTETRPVAPPGTVDLAAVRARKRRR